jgi:hypothetical protein|nr:MAG TPA: hypothetical protein [Caudoviricetes sp.]
MSIAVPLYGFGASGGEGGTLKVNAPPLVAVTITNKAGKTKTKTANADGMAIFKGLASGKWNVTIVNSDGKPTTITADVQTEYTVTIAFFSATINITYPAGSTCTCSDGKTTLSAPDTSGTWACIVPNAGTWTVSSTDGDKSKSADVVITTDGQTESVTLLYITHLFNNGDTCDAITGGWGTGSTSAGSASILGQQISIAANAQKNFSCGPKNKIDVSEYEALSVAVDSIGGGKLSVYLYATSISNPAAKVTTATTGTVSLDISSVFGANTVMLSFYSEKGGSVKVSEVSLM